jgi:plastocyanin
VEHNFHLRGPNVDEATSVEETGEVTWTVTFVDGLYHFQCDPHAFQMKGDFAVGSATVPPPPPPPPPPSGGGGKKVAKLKATVGPGYSISLKAGSKAVHKLSASKIYSITVSDKSAIHNFHLMGAGVNKKTSVSKKGKSTWRVKFKKGKTYRFRCDSHPTILKGSFKAS